MNGISGPVGMGSIISMVSSDMRRQLKLDAAILNASVEGMMALDIIEGNEDARSSIRRDRRPMHLTYSYRGNQ